MNPPCAFYSGIISYNWGKCLASTNSPIKNCTFLPKLDIIMPPKDLYYISKKGDQSMWIIFILIIVAAAIIAVGIAEHKRKEKAKERARQGREKRMAALEQQ